jgi:hypothetical protein
VPFGVRSGLVNEALQVDKIPRKRGLNIIKPNIIPASPNQPQNVNDSCNNKITHLGTPSSATHVKKSIKIRNINDPAK